MIESEQTDIRRTMGVIDGSLTQLALAIVLLPITVAAVLFRPDLLRSQLDHIQDAGHRGALLSPGPFFASGFMVLLIGAAFAPADGLLIAIGRDVRDATTEGHVWAAALRLAPLFLMAILLGLVFFTSAHACRLRRRSLQASLRAGIYAVFGMVCVVIVGEPLSVLIGPGGDNMVYEPALVALVGLWMSYFFAGTVGGPADGLMKRVGAALLSASICAIALAGSYAL